MNKYRDHKILNIFYALYVALVNCVTHVHIDMNLQSVETRNDILMHFKL